MTTGARLSSRTITVKPLFNFVFKVSANAGTDNASSDNANKVGRNIVSPYHFNLKGKCDNKRKTFFRQPENIFLHENIGRKPKFQ